MKALGLAESFNLAVGDKKVAGHRVELSAPEGPSTGGGKQSVQHIKLIPDGGGTVLVAGSADQVSRSAELRSYGYLAALHARRFRGAALPLDRAAYEELLRRAQAFFADRGLTVTRVETPPEPPPTPRKGSAGLIAGVLVVVAALVGAAVYFVIGR